MACVTLKRPLPLEHPFESALVSNSPHQRPPSTKRRRFLEGEEGSRRDLFEASTSQAVHQQQNHQQMTPQAPPTVFRETPLTPVAIASNLRDELKRLRKRKAVESGPFASQSPPSSPEPMEDNSALRLAHQALSIQATNPEFMAGPSSPKSAKDKPVFTLRQMTMICEKLCKERTDQVRAEYDRILQMKLAEQYEAFVKFIDHQVHQRLNESQLPSYLS